MQKASLTTLKVQKQASRTNLRKLKKATDNVPKKFSAHPKRMIEDSNTSIKKEDEETAAQSLNAIENTSNKITQTTCKEVAEVNFYIVIMFTSLY